LWWTRKVADSSTERVRVVDEASNSASSLRDSSQAASVVAQHYHTDELRKLQLRGLHKWGIPIGASYQDDLEIVLLARIVWVKYKRRDKILFIFNLWPAILFYFILFCMSIEYMS
jgi:hypothetical protein